MDKKEILDWMARAETPQELRKIHKELKRYGDRIYFHRRYPNFSFVVSCIALVGSILLLIMKILIG